jgi:hypothetical protein
MTAATLDVEANIVTGKGEGFQTADMSIPALTLTAHWNPVNGWIPSKVTTGSR